MPPHHIHRAACTSGIVVASEGCLHRFVDRNTGILGDDHFEAPAATAPDAAPSTPNCATTCSGQRVRRSFDAWRRRIPSINVKSSAEVLSPGEVVPLLVDLIVACIRASSECCTRPADEHVAGEAILFEAGMPEHGFQSACRREA